MIFTDRTITIRNNKSTINEPVVLYRGDYEVSIRFTIMESKFRFKSGVNLVDSEKASHGQLAILAPYGGNVFSEIVKCEDGTVTFTLTKEMIDQLEEVGLYSFQIRLFDYYRESRVSIPPVEFGIEVREPVASEDHDNEVSNAIVGYSIAKVVDGLNEDVPDTFDINEQYNKTDWKTGDRISEGKLNKIEDALDKINQNEINNKNALNKQMTSNFNVLQSQIDNMVIESGNTDVEVEQARGEYNLLNQRLNAMDETDVELAKQVARKVNQTDLDSEIVSRRIRGQNNPNSPAGTFDFANFAQQGQETGIASTPIGGVIHHYTDGKVLQIDNVGENNVILTMVNANNTSRRPDKDSTFYGNGYFMQLFTNNQNKRDDENTGGVYPHLTIDEKGMLFWSGYTPTGVKTNSTLFTTGKDHGYTPAYIFKCTIEHEILMQLQNTNYAVMSFGWNKTVNCGEINTPSNMNGLNINTITGDIRMSPQNGNLRIDNIAYINKKDSRGAKQIAIIDFGTTEERPTTNLECGMMYFDRTLNKPIWRNASNNGWVDATGQSV